MQSAFDFLDGLGNRGLQWSIRYGLLKEHDGVYVSIGTPPADQRIGEEPFFAQARVASAEKALDWLKMMAPLVPERE